MSDLLAQARVDLKEAREEEERLNRPNSGRVIVSPRVVALTGRATAAILLDIAETLRLICDHEERGR